MKRVKRNSLLLFAAGVLAAATIILFVDFQYFKQDERYGTVRPLPNMMSQRSAHTATLISDGRILIIGGILKAEGAEVNNSSSEFFIPGLERFSTGPEMSRRRAGHTATVLYNGDVLVTGGFNSTGFLSSAELYNNASGKFEVLQSEMNEKRAGHTATLMADGRVLLTGGVNGNAHSNKNAEIFDLKTKRFVEVGSMIEPRTGHTATLLKNKKVLIAGGSSHWRSGVLNSCEFFDPAKNVFSKGLSMNFPRTKHAAISLKDGTVLIAGGSSRADIIGRRYNTVELFDPEKEYFTQVTNKMSKGRFKITNAAGILPDGKAVIAGDGKYIEIFDPATKTFITAKGSLEKAWMYPCVITLRDGKTLICGGYDSRMKTTNLAWILETTRPPTSSSYSFSLFIKNFLLIIRS